MSVGLRSLGILIAMAVTSLEGKGIRSNESDGVMLLLTYITDLGCCSAVEVVGSMRVHE